MSIESEVTTRESFSAKREYCTRLLGDLIVGDAIARWAVSNDPATGLPGAAIGFVTNFLQEKMVMIKTGLPSDGQLTRTTDTLYYDTAEWEAFVSGVKDGEF